jgi:DNA (cytosine-5)-methyltransferase 1
MAAVSQGTPWPQAAWGYKGNVYAADVSNFPVKRQHRHLREFLLYPRVPLSYRAAAGFFSRALTSGLRFEDRFLEDVKRHIRQMAKLQDAA